MIQLRQSPALWATAHDHRTWVHGTDLGTDWAARVSRARRWGRNVAAFQTWNKIKRDGRRYGTEKRGFAPQRAETTNRAGHVEVPNLRTRVNELEALLRTSGSWR